MNIVCVEIVTDMLTRKTQNRTVQKTKRMSITEPIKKKKEKQLGRTLVLAMSFETLILFTNLISECTPGTFYELNSCRECEKGEFQEHWNKRICTRCPLGYSTINRKSTKLTDCIGKIQKRFTFTVLIMYLPHFINEILPHQCCNI